MSRPQKKSYNQKVDFSDEQIYDEIKDEVRAIKESNLKKLDEEFKIYEIYTARKQQKRKQKYRDPTKLDILSIGQMNQRDSSDEEGQINQKPKIEQNPFNDFNFEGIPSISNLGDHIRPLTLTRNRIVDLLNSRRFQQLVKGCFVRYLIDSNANSNSNSYIIAQIVGVTEGNKEYTVNNVKTRVLLKLQETSQTVVTLSLQLISNQHPPGGLQIEKWLQTNRNKIPKEQELKEKLDEHNKLLVEQLSSDQIDSNIWRKAKRIAELNQDLKEDVNHLIDFVSQKLHNLQIQIDDEKIGRNKKRDQNKLQVERKEASSVLEILQKLRGEFLKVRALQKKKTEQAKRMYYTMDMMEEKKSDLISQKCKARYIMLATYEGYEKLRDNVIQNHVKYNFELAEEDMEY